MKFLVILFLFFNLQSWTKADDIKEFQIEGISIGNSLLKYMTKEEISSANELQTKMGDYTMIYYNYSTDNDRLYDFIQIAYLIGDDNYEIHQVTGFLKFAKNIKECLIKKKEIEKDISDSFTQTNISRIEDIKHPYDKSGNTKVWSTDYAFDTGGVVNVGCTDWSKDFENKKKWVDSLDISITSEKYWNYLAKYYYQ